LDIANRADYDDGDVPNEAQRCSKLGGHLHRNMIGEREKRSEKVEWRWRWMVQVVFGGPAGGCGVRGTV